MSVLNLYIWEHGHEPTPGIGKRDAPASDNGLNRLRMDETSATHRLLDAAPMRPAADALEQTVNCRSLRANSIAAISLFVVASTCVYSQSTASMTQTVIQRNTISVLSASPTSSLT